MRIALVAALALVATPLSAQADPAPAAPVADQSELSLNPQVDFDGFSDLTDQVREYRLGRLLPFARFMQEAAQPGALLLDARSRQAFDEGHIEGAVNLPLTDFTAESLAEVIGPDRNWPIYIYCNNNFSNGVPPVPTKMVQLALNIQTFINLVGYEYPNVWELNDVVDAREPEVAWVGDMNMLTGDLRLVPLSSLTP